MEDLIAFIKAQLDEDEAAANEVHLPRTCGSTDRDGEFDPDPVWCGCGHPARVLREIEAKRAILVDHGAQRDGTDVGCSRCSWDHYVIEDEPNGCPTLRALASVWSDHPGYRAEWAA